MATEACGGGTPDLGFFSGISVFIGIFGISFTSGGPRVNDKATTVNNWKTPGTSVSGRENVPVAMCLIFLSLVFLR